jgi:crotonobetainyl-CoA:carnitine CoA-transferase CaiB-like acyl-CoA transferase
MLSHYRILDLTDDRGHFAGFLFAQLGADVIAVEPPDGQRSRFLPPFAADTHDGEFSLQHWSYNRGKRSVIIDDQETLVELARTADVLIECGAFDIDLEELREVNPSLVTVSMSNFGQDGPKSEWVGTDLTLSAAAGPMSLNGHRDRPPVRISAPQVWVNAASEAACAALIALTERKVSGFGQHVDVSAQEAMILTAQGWMAPSLCDNPPAQRTGGGFELLGMVEFRFVYECSDGYVTITFLPGVLVGSFTNRLLEWVRNEGHLDEDLNDIDWTDLLTDRPLEEVASITDRTSRCLAKALLPYSKDHLFSMAQQDKLLLVPVITPSDVLETPHYTERKFWDEVEMPQIRRKVRFPGPWAHGDTIGLKRLGRPPKLGEHTEEVLSEVPQIRTFDGDLKPPSQLPFEGLTVLDFTWVYAGPFATRMLGYYGARVIRVESQTRPDQVRTSGLSRDPEDPDGPENSQQWHSINAHKESLQLNLKAPEARQVVLDLAAKSDIVVNAFSAGVLDRVGLSPAELLEVNPRLIICSTTLFGQTGPLSPIPGFGNMGAATGGYYELTGWADRLPAGPFLAYTDATSPRLTAALLMAALDHRERTGEGMILDFSQAEGGIHFLTEAMLDQEVNGYAQTRIGNADRWMAPHSVYQCANEQDDQWVAIACENDDQWASLASIVGCLDLADLGLTQRQEREEDLDSILQSWCSSRSPSEITDLLQSVGVPVHQVQNSPEIVSDGQLIHRSHFVEVPHDVYESTWVEQYGFRLSRSDGTPNRSGPLWGEHNFQILSDLLGYDGDAIADLVIAGVLE